MFAKSKRAKPWRSAQAEIDEMQSEMDGTNVPTITRGGRFGKPVHIKPLLEDMIADRRKFIERQRESLGLS